MIAPTVLARYGGGTSGTTLPMNVCSHCGETDSPEDTRHWPDDADGDRICPLCAERLLAAAASLFAACQRAADALECADDDVATLVGKLQAAQECRAAIRLALEGK